MAPERHVKTRAKNHSCPKKGCGISYTNPKDLRGHLRTAHAADKLRCPYLKCSQKVFTDESNMSRHIKQCHEDNAKWWACPGMDCEYYSGRKDNVVRHARSCRMNDFRMAPVEVNVPLEEQIPAGAADQQAEIAAPVAVAQQPQVELGAPVPSSVPVDPALLQTNYAEQPCYAEVQQQEAGQLPLGWPTTEHYQQLPILDLGEEEMRALLLPKLEKDGSTDL